jgi:hypothetical protein
MIDPWLAGRFSFILFRVPKFDEVMILRSFKEFQRILVHLRDHKLSMKLVEVFLGEGDIVSHAGIDKVSLLVLGRVLAEGSQSLSVSSRYLVHRVCLPRW